MNWSKARDWEVIEGARKGWDEGAIAEAQRRGLVVKPPERNKGVYYSKPTQEPYEDYMTRLEVALENDDWGDRDP